MLEKAIGNHSAVEGSIDFAFVVQIVSLHFDYCYLLRRDDAAIASMHSRVCVQQTTREITQ
jgi:hypothetical protein